MSDSGKHVIRVRGLPWSATKDDLAKHFSDCNLPKGADSVHLTYQKDGKPSGEAYLELATKEDADNAKKKDRTYIGKRYIEVFLSTPSEMDWVVRRSGPDQSSGDAIVRLRGLPFTCSKEEIANFFSGLEIEPNGISLIIDPRDPKGRGTGEAFVQFASPDIAEQAMLKNKEMMGHRYIEIFKSSFQEARSYLSQARMRVQGMGGGGGGGGGGRPGPYDRMDRFGGGGGGGGFGGGGGGMGGGAYGPRGRNRLGNMKGMGGGFGGFDDFDNGYGGGGFGGGGFGGGGGGFGGGRRDMMGDGFGMGGGGGGGRYGGGMGMGGGRMGGGGGGGGGRGGGGGGGRGGTPGESYENSVTGHWVHMRGLPFSSTEDDIVKFFRPNANPINIEIHFANGRATGEADVDFASHEDAVAAMKKDKEQMKHRYIELFLHSSPDSGNGSMSNSGMGGNMGMGMGNNMMGNQMGYGGMGSDYSSGDGYGGGNFGDNMGYGGGMNRNMGGMGGGNRFGGGGGGFGGNYTSFS